jgi:hypothetical protein
VSGVGENRSVYRILVENPERTNRWEYLSIHGRIILIWIFRKYNGGVD